MSYLPGPTHPGLVHSGSVPIAAPIGLKIALQGLPGAFGHVGTAAVDYFQVGKVALGNVDGQLASIQLRHAAQLVYPIADSMTALAYDLEPGITMSVTELLAPAALASSLNPWDRHPAIVASGNPATIPGGTPPTVWWTYTVPAGRILAVAKLDAWIERWSAASSSNYSQVWITINGAQVVAVVSTAAAVGAQSRDALDASNLWLPAGTVIQANYRNEDTGGQIWINSELAGTLFDA